MLKKFKSLTIAADKGYYGEYIEQLLSTSYRTTSQKIEEVEKFADSRFASGKKFGRTMAIEQIERELERIK